MNCNFLYRVGIVFGIIFFVFGCKTKEQLIVNQGNVFGSTYGIQYDSKINYHQQIREIFNQFNLAVSTYQDNSEIVRFNQSKSGIASDSKILLNLIKISKELHIKTNQYFDPSVSPLIDLWGFGSKPIDREPDSNQIKETLTYVGMNWIELQEQKILKKDSRTMLNFNSVTGYCNDLIAKFLEEKGVENYLIEIGGEIVAKGKKPNGKNWIVGIDKPKAGQRKQQAKIMLQDAALATSGNYRKTRTNKNGQKFVHTINPKTGLATASNVLSATVITNSCAKADAFATAIVAMGSEKSKEFLAQNKDVQAYLIVSDKNSDLEIKTYNGFHKILID